MKFKPITPRLLTAYYALALLVIAGLSIGSHVMLSFELFTNRGSAAVINIAGRQRMLSQRIASLAAQYRLGDAGVRDDLRAAIVTFEATHDALVLASRTSAAADGASGALASLYFEGASPLDVEARGFIADARRILDATPDDPLLPTLLSRIFLASRETLLTKLDQVVSIHQARSEQLLAQLGRLQWGILAIVLITLAVEAIAIFRPMIARIAAYMAELVLLASTDPLTGAATRRSFAERGTVEIERARRYERPASLLMLDIDRFKAINDTHGHAAGDEVLRAVGRILAHSLRPMDICGRLGGEEFAIVAVETAHQSAMVLGERLRATFEATTVPYLDGTIGFTVSIGVASLQLDASGLEDMLREADKHLYEAKHNGRNRVVGPPSPDLPEMAFAAVAG